jgi:hypothetical protein
MSSTGATGDVGISADQDAIIAGTLCVIPFLLIVCCLCGWARLCCGGCGPRKSTVSPYLYSNDSHELTDLTNADLTPLIGVLYTQGIVLPTAFSLHLRFDCTVYPRRIYGHGYDTTGSFTVSDGVLSVDRDSRGRRCCLVLSRNGGVSRVIVVYGQCEDLHLIRFSGHWAETDASKQGTFSFEVDRALVVQQQRTLQILPTAVHMHRTETAVALADL